ncbi:metal-dependent hydrolase [Desulfococcaceae bacterium HSG9]|nr:metal-dependent hydrolase [Desulfococcaceae bacterium HSG9]
MAAFQTHVTVGLVVGYIAGLFAVVTQWIVAPFMPLCMFAAAFIGAFLPDLDSNYSKPFNIVFSHAAIIGGSAVFFYFTLQKTIPWFYWGIIPPVSALVIRYGIGKIFQKFTTHRGIFHSIPGIFIATLATPPVLSFIPLASKDVAAISMSVGIGFLSHLVLDEICSIFDFKGFKTKIKVKRSFGTAMTFTCPSAAVTLAAYFLLAVLIFYNRQLLIEVFPGLNVHF